MKTTHEQYQQIITNYNFIKGKYNILKPNIAWLTLETLEHNEYIDLTTIINNTVQAVSHVRNTMLALIQKQQIESLTLEETRLIFNLGNFLAPSSNVYTNISSLINLILENNSVNRQAILHKTSILYQSIEGINSYYTYSEGILFHLLNHAITHDNNNIINILLNYGANPFQCNNYGYSAFYNTLSLFASDKEIMAKKFLYLQLKQKSLTMTEFAYNNACAELKNNSGAKFFSYLTYQLSCKHSKLAEICGFNNMTHKIHFEYVKQLAQNSSNSFKDHLKIKDLRFEDKIVPCNELNDELLYSYYSSLYNKLHHIFNTAGVITSQQLLIAINIPISTQVLFAALNFIVPNSGKIMEAMTTIAKSNTIKADAAKLMGFILDPDKLKEVLKTTAEKITIWKKQEIKYIATQDNEEIASWKYQSSSDKIKKIFIIDINSEIYRTNPSILGCIDALKIMRTIIENNISVNEESTECIATQLASSISKYTYSTDHLVIPKIEKIDKRWECSYCSIFSVVKIVYDNILLNYPKLLKKFSDNHGNKVTSHLISLMSQLSINCKDFVEEICDNDNLQALELLMGIDSNVYQEM